MPYIKIRRYIFKGKTMDKEEKKQTGISLFGQSEFLVGDDPLEEMFALNLGDFISETLISEDLAKKISITANKKEIGRASCRERV